MPSGVVDQIREQIELANTRVDALEKEPWFKSEDIELLHSVADDGCDVRLVSRSGTGEFLEPLADSGVRVRHSTEVKTSLYLIDDDKVVLNIGRGDTGIVFRDSATATVLSAEFEEIFNSATRVTTHDT